MVRISFDVTSVKSFRELLCFASARILQSPLDDDQKAWRVRELQNLINQCDVLRPIGADGKHGNRHTLFCGCAVIEDLLQRTPVVRSEVDDLLTGISLLDMSYLTQPRWPIEDGERL